MKKVFLLLLAAVCVSSHLCSQNTPCDMVVDFMADSVASSPTINFTNLSTPLDASDSTVWTFGDGYMSYEINPSHTYNHGGIYTVCLRIKKNAASPVCTREYCRQVYVPIDCGAPPDFNFAPDSNGAYYSFWTVMPFTQYDYFVWDFGDGTPLMNTNNGYVVHQFATAGTYNVCVTRKRITPGTTTLFCESQVCRQVAHNTPVCNTTANFSFAANPGNQQQFQFTNLTTPFVATDTVYWSFGDGYGSYETNPVHTFRDGGTYYVWLYAVTYDPANGGLPCQSQYQQAVTVPYTCNIVPSFNWSVDSFMQANTYDFYNTSQPYNWADSCFWDFGDGSPVEFKHSYESIRHAFPGAGSYNVCLTIKKMQPGTNIVVCQHQTCSTVVNTTQPCNVNAAFTHRQNLSGNSNLQELFFATGTGNSFTWDFGDGASGSGSYQTHQYAQQGNYSVCLTVDAGATCTASQCSTVSVLPNRCDTNTVSYTYHPDYYLPNKLYFFSETYSPFYSQLWTVKKNGTQYDSIYTTQSNPYIVFSDIGTYQVCLVVDFQSGCHKSFCDDVVINSVSPPSYCYLLSYPNPAINTVAFNMQLDVAGPVTANIYSLQGVAVGQFVQQGVAGNNVISLDISTLPVGFYSVRITYGNYTCYSRFQKI